MNDDFLSSFRQPPQPGFAQALHAKLTQAAPTGSRRPVVKRIGYTLAVLSLLLTLVIAISPTVRTAALTVITEIIQIFTVKGTVVIVDADQPAVSGEGETYAEIWKPGSPAGITVDHPGLARFPAWVPNGFALQERAALIYASMYEKTPHAVLLEWKNERSETIQLLIEKGSCPSGASLDPQDSALELGSNCSRAALFSVGEENQPEQVTVNDQPAILFHNLQIQMNLSDPVREWNPSRWKFSNNNREALYLTWEKDELTFSLASQAQNITGKVLLRIAGSIP